MLTMPDFVGGSKDELGALKARQIIARGEASAASETPGHSAKLMRALKGRKMFLPPFQGLDQFLYFTRGEASAASETPGHSAKLMRALKGRKMFLPPFQGLDQFLTLPGVKRAQRAKPLAIIYRAFSALAESPINPTGSGKLKLKTETISVSTGE
jgi:hypothetical protein